MGGVNLQDPLFQSVTFLSHQHLNSIDDRARFPLLSLSCSTSYDCFKFCPAFPQESLL